MAKKTVNSAVVQTRSNDGKSVLFDVWP